MEEGASKCVQSDESGALLHHLKSRVFDHNLPGEEMAIREEGKWAMFCWETLGPPIHVDVTSTRTTYQNIVPDQVEPFIKKCSATLKSGSGIVQRVDLAFKRHQISI